MKKSVLFIALMAVTMTAGAQRNDLYSTGRNKSNQSSGTETSVITRTPSSTVPAQTVPAQTVQTQTIQAQTVPAQTVPSQAAPAVTTTPKIIVDRDPDEYNRRYTYGTSQIQYEDGSILDDVPTVYIHDTIYVSDEYEKEDRSSYAEGYSDAVDDFYLTRRLYRFRHHARPYYSIVDDTASSAR